MLAARRACGFTLLEMLLALASGALLLSSVMPMLNMTIASATSSATSDQADLERQAAFAVDRIARVVRATAPPVPAPLPPPPPGLSATASSAGTVPPAVTTTGTWFAPSTFQRSGISAPYTLVETIQGDPAPHVLADSVTAVAFTQLPLTDGRQLVQVDLTLTNGNATTTVSSVMRMGWLQ